MASPQSYAILPILNKSTNTNTSLPWVLADDLILRGLEDREKRLVIEDTSIVFPASDVGGEIFILSLEDSVNKRRGNAKQKRKQVEEYIRLDALSLQAVFNFLAVEETMVIPYGMIIEKTKKPKLLYVLDFEQDFSSAKLRPYSILPNVASLEVQMLIQTVRKVIKIDRTLQTTLRRFCSAFMKTNREDRLIDLTIALESLVPSQTEISFKFAFFLSLIISNDKSIRNDAFNKLRNLYTARSGIVHGTINNPEIKKSIKNSQDNWEELVAYAKQCILYRIEFKDKYPNEDWMHHLLKMGFGESSIGQI